MSTDRREVESLAARLRRATGWIGVCTLFYDENGLENYVFYKNRIRTILGFAEMARADLFKAEQGAQS
jgi:hypothetical protein